MATIPVERRDIAAHFGPHLGRASGMRLEPGVEPDRLVKTHCCFCGQQCGIQLRVKGNEVIGFEPWLDFPFNQGKLCPKGIKRYLQGSHPDRLLHAYKRDPSAPGGFRAVAYGDAVARVAAELERIQARYGRDAFALLSGASLTIEKTYLVGKPARMCLKTANIDYNGRLCMVSAAAGNKKAFGIDRAANPWSDILKAEVVWISGANVAECAPITTDYVWQAREHGAAVVVVDPRLTPIARTCDLFLPIKPGRDVALFNGILHLMIEHDWLDHDFIGRHTVGFDAVAAQAKAWTPRRTAEVTGIAERAIRQAAELWGRAKTSFLMHARGIEHHSHGVQNVLGAINMVLASGRIGQEGCGYATAEGRVIKINKAVDCPGEARQDWRILQGIAKALGRERGFTFASPRDILDELRLSSRGGIADYSGITYEKVEHANGVFWPCPVDDHPGTPRLFEPGSWNPVAQGRGPFYFPDGKARFNGVDYAPPAEDVDAEYPLMLTTGRVVSHFLSGAQTRRLGPLVDHIPEPYIEMHPQLAARLGIADGDWVTAETRRGDCTLRARVVRTIRPDTIFIPYHWPGRKSVNQLTIAAQDPISRIPAYKVCAVRLKRASGRSASPDRPEPQP